MDNTFSDTELFECFDPPEARFRPRGPVNQPGTFSVDSVVVRFEDRPLRDPPPENTVGSDD